MPSVPRYDALQVGSQALPGARQQSIASSELLGAQGDAIAHTGAAIQKAGGEAAKVLGEIQDRSNVDGVFRAETAFRDDLLKFEIEQRSKKGAEALADGGVTEQTQKWFGEHAVKHFDGLANEAQQRAFGKITENLRLQTLGTLSTHQANEARASVTDSANATIVGAINRAAANPNDWTVAEAESKNIRERVAVLAKVNGYTPEMTAEVTGKHLSELHKQMIQQLVKSNPAAVKGYYDKYEKEIDGSQRAEIGAYAAKATATSIGDGAADAVWKSDGPKNRTDPVTLSTMEEKVRTALKGNDEGIKVAIAGLRERATAYKDQRKEEGNALEASVNNLIIGGQPAGAVRKSPEFLKLSAQDPEAARKVMDYMDNKALRAEQVAASRESRAYTAEARADLRLHRDTLDTALRVSDPTRLASMTRDEVVNLLPVLGSTSTQALVAKWDSFAKNTDKLHEAKIDRQDFDTIALSAGFRPNEPHKSEDEKDRLVRLQAQVENAIDVEQRAKGKVLSRTEKTDIMHREIDNAVLTPKFFGLSSDKRPVSVLTPDQQKAAFVLAGPNKEKVMLSDIPAPFRLQAMKSRAAQGLPTSEQQLAELYLMRKAK
jgi:hypothetical protein